MIETTMIEIAACQETGQQAMFINPKLITHLTFSNQSDGNCAILCHLVSKAFITINCKSREQAHAVATKISYSI